MEFWLFITSNQNELFATPNIYAYYGSKLFINSFFLQDSQRALLFMVNNLIKLIHKTLIIFLLLYQESF
jgi:hypothetical protein